MVTAGRYAEGAVPAVGEEQQQKRSRDALHTGRAQPWRQDRCLSETRDAVHFLLQQDTTVVHGFSYPFVVRALLQH